MSIFETPRFRALAVLIAVSLGAAACGGSAESAAVDSVVSATPSDESAEAPTADARPTATSTTDAPTTAPSTTAPANDASSSSTTAPPTSEATTTTEVEEPRINLFPDVDVTNIADGATVNLAEELGGGDKATLLWFFAPH